VTACPCAPPKAARDCAACSKRWKAEVTREGLWLISTAEESKGERFRVVATAVGRAADVTQPSRLRVNGASSPHSVSGDETSPEPAGEDAGATSEGVLPSLGTVEVAGDVVRFIRRGLTEEYRVSVDGVQQDFIIAQRPGGRGPLRVDLDVAGARAEPLANGARLVLEGSGRKLNYDRLRVTDATGKELPTRMEVVSESARGSYPFIADQGNSTSQSARGLAQSKTLREFKGGMSRRQLLDCASPLALSDDAANASEALKVGTMKRPEVRAPALAVLVEDTEAVYPIRIDPTFSDADWFGLGAFSGANGSVYASVVDGSGNLYIGGSFTAVGEAQASSIAKWDGSAWSALGSGMNSQVYALAVSGSDLYAGGYFTTAGGVSANYIAKWNGSAWSALGLGMNNSVSALAVSGSDLYAAGGFITAGGVSANRIAKWNGSAWSALGSGMNDYVSALAVSGNDLYAGGGFITAGGKVSGYAARAYIGIRPRLSILRSGANVTLSWPSAGTAGFLLEHAPTVAHPASWTANGAPVTDNTTNKSVSIPATSSQQFFRLRKP
jgi:hypothetical protein